MFAPMARNIDAPADPDLVVLLDMIDESFEGMNTPGPTDQPAMQTDRHHPRNSGALNVERIETVAQIGEKLLARVESLRRCKTYVVCIEGIGHHQVIFVGDPGPVGQIIVIGVGVIQKSAFFYEQFARVITGPTGIPTKWSFAGYT